MSRVRVRVVKVGGSWLTSHELPRRLRNWLAAQATAQPDSHFVLLAGGGKWVDAIRAIDARTPLGEERAHWICVALMDITAGLLGAMLPELRAAATLDELAVRLHEPGVTLLRPRRFVEEREPALPGTRLPANWSVTSDSIAGRLAVVLGADELVLLKSVPPPVAAGGQNWLEQLATTGHVDEFLPRLSAELPPVRCTILD